VPIACYGFVLDVNFVDTDMGVSILIWVHSPPQELRALVYPLVQVLLGAARLVPAPRYFPLRLRLARALHRLAASANVLVPLSPLLLEMLQWSDLSKTPQARPLCHPLVYSFRKPVCPCPFAVLPELLQWSGLCEVPQARLFDGSCDPGPLSNLPWSFVTAVCDAPAGAMLHSPHANWCPSCDQAHIPEFLQMVHTMLLCAAGRHWAAAGHAAGAAGQQVGAAHLRLSGGGRHAGTFSICLCFCSRGMHVPLSAAIAHIGIESAKWLQSDSRAPTAELWKLAAVDASSHCARYANCSPDVTRST